VCKPFLSRLLCLVLKLYAVKLFRLARHR
jgi:hypothetical protein